MNEYMMILIFILSAGLWALGGTKGKFWRRFVLPCLLSGFAVVAGVETTNILWFLGLSVFTFSLGYGDTKPYWYKTLVGCSYSLAILPLGFTPWLFILPLVFISTFALSNYFKTASMFPWKICELLTGAMVGISVGIILFNK